MANLLNGRVAGLPDSVGDLSALSSEDLAALARGLILTMSADWTLGYLEGMGLKLEQNGARAIDIWSEVARRGMKLVVAKPE